MAKKEKTPSYRSSVGREDGYIQTIPRSFLKFNRDSFKKSTRRELAQILVIEGPFYGEGECPWGTHILPFKAAQIYIPELTLNDYHKTMAFLKKSGHIYTKKVGLNWIIYSLKYEEYQKKPRPGDLISEASCSNFDAQVKGSVSTLIPSLSDMIKYLHAQVNGFPRPGERIPEATSYIEDKEILEIKREKGGNIPQTPSSTETEDEDCKEPVSVGNKKKEDEMDVRLAITPSVATIGTRRSEKPRAPRKTKKIEGYGDLVTDGEAKGIFHSDTLVKMFRREIRQVWPDAKFDNINIVGERNSANVLIDFLCEATGIPKSNEPLMAVTAKSWFSWYADRKVKHNKNGTSKKRFRQTDGSVQNLKATWDEYKAVMDKPEHILARQTKIKKATRLPDILDRLDEIFESDFMGEAATTRSSISKYGVVITANYLKIRRGVEDPESLIRQLILEDCQKPYGSNLIKKSYQASCKFSCDSTKMSMIPFARWKEIFSDLWGKLDNPTEPSEDSSARKRADKFFEDLAYSM